MNACEEGEDDVVLPAQQMQQPQPAQGTQDKGWASRAGSLAGSAILGAHCGGSDKSPEQMPGLDEARFTAGVVRFYEAILREPIPETMLRLLDEIGKQERKL